MKTGTRLLVASSLLAAGLALPVIASGDDRENGEGAGACACSQGCSCSAPADPAPARGAVARKKQRKADAPAKAAKRAEPSPRARAEKLGIWLHEWAEGHPRLAEMGPKLLMLREFRPSEYLRALDDLPGPARRDVVGAMDRLAEYEALLASRPDDFRDFVHEHFPERWEHMMHLWGVPGPEADDHAGPRGGAPAHPHPRVAPPRPNTPHPSAEADEDDGQGAVFELVVPGHGDHDDDDDEKNDSDDDEDEDRDNSV